jgi:hypothetical protein
MKAIHYWIEVNLLHYFNLLINQFLDVLIKMMLIWNC